MDLALANLFCAALVFSGGHLAISSTPLRGHLVTRFGRHLYLAGYSLLAIISLTWLILAYGHAPHIDLWGKPDWARWPALVTMPVSCTLIVGAYRLDNPTALLYRPGMFDIRHSGLFAVTRHPLMWGVALWAGTHILANGDLASLILFGALGALALIGTVAIDARKRRDDAPLWTALASATSNVPLVALMAGRARLEPQRLLGPAAGGLLLYGLLLWAHPRLFGPSPLP